MVKKYRKLISFLTPIIILLTIIVASKLFMAEVPVAVVKGNSMLPLLREGDIVFIVKSGPQNIEVGDIVVYRTYTGSLIIHRVIEVREIDGKYYYVTKGDNNNIPDVHHFDYGIGISGERVVGKVVSVDHTVFKIPYIGNLVLLFRK